MVVGHHVEDVGVRKPGEHGTAQCTTGHEERKSGLQAQASGLWPLDGVTGIGPVISGLIGAMRGAPSSPFPSGWVAGRVGQAEVRRIGNVSYGRTDWNSVSQ